MEFQLKISNIVHHAWKPKHQNVGDFAMVERQINEGFQQVKDFIMVEENLKNQNSEMHRIEGS